MLNFFFSFFFGVPALTCLEEVPLGTILSVVVLLRGEEEPHSSHLTRTHAHTHTNQAFKCCSASQRSSSPRPQRRRRRRAWFMLPIIVGSTYQILLEQSQTHAVRLDALPAAKPLRPVVVDETSRLRGAQRGRKKKHTLSSVSRALCRDSRRLGGVKFSQDRGGADDLSHVQ